MFGLFKKKEQRKYYTFNEKSKKSSKPTPRFGSKWSKDENEILEVKWRDDVSIENIAKELKRTENGIRKRIKFLELDVKLGKELPPSTYQIRTIKKLGGEDVKLPSNTSEASMMIDELILKNGSKFDPLPSQIQTLKYLGHNEIPENIQEADKLIKNYISTEFKKLGYSKTPPGRTFDAVNLLRKIRRENENKK